YSCISFFFQAEDGIRDFHVTGVQTCALPIFLQPGANAATQGSAHRVFYNAVAQFKSAERTGALLSAWSTIDPMKVEQGLGTDYPIVAPRTCPVCTGLFITDFESEQSERGDIYVFSELMNGASEIFAGTITELHADANFVLAGKQGVSSDIATPDSAVHNFVGSLLDEMKKNPETGATYLEATQGELLIFTVANGDGQFGLPYLLKGRVDLPYPEVYGL